jgi:hypothetical protein
MHAACLCLAGYSCERDVRDSPSTHTTNDTHLERVGFHGVLSWTKAIRVNVTVQFHFLCEFRCQCAVHGSGEVSQCICERKFFLEKKR